jgi:DMSO/TMAO reductase YedYZ heme-binding membrane subunit
VAQKFLGQQAHTDITMGLSAGFGVGAMIHAVLHFGMYFELRSTSKCDDILVAITPLTQAAFIIMQMIFIFSDNNKVRAWDKVTCTAYKYV